MAAKIAKEITAINRGMGEKVGTIIFSLCAFVFGFLASFYWGWKLTLIPMATFPIFIILGYSMATVMKDGTVDQMRAYSQSAGYAEQALSGIRVVHTYCQENLEIKNYIKYL